MSSEVRRGGLSRPRRGWLFLGLLTVYLASPVKVQSDTGWTVPTALSLLREGNLDLDEYAATFGPAGDYRVVEGRDGHWMPFFPVLPAVVIAPALGLVEGARSLLEPVGVHLPGLGRALARWRSHVDAVGHIDLTFFDTVEHVFSSLLCALAMVLFAQAASRVVDARAAILAAVVLGLGTSVYSSVSRLLWQQSVSLPLSCLLLLGLVSWRGQRGGFALGVVAGLLYVARPTHAVVVLALLGFLWATRRAQVLPYLAGGALVALGLVLHAQVAFGSWLPPYYAPGRLGPTAAGFAEAALGHWVSPARGLALYSPVLLIGFVSFGWRARRRDVSALEVLACASVVLLWLSISAFPHWWGGHSFGPRLFADALPWAAWLLLRPCAALAGGAWSRPAAAGFTACALLSVAIHLRGATSLAPHRWNDHPVDVDAAPDRLWEWRDAPVLRR